MSVLSEARGIFVDAETRLRELLSRAVAAADYGALARLTELAREMARIAAELGTMESDSAPVGPLREPLREAEAGRPGNGRQVRYGTADAGRPIARGYRTPASRNEYPRFLRNGNELVKIGWSRKKRGEYVHKAPRAAVDALLRAIAARQSGARLFTADELFSHDRPLKDPATGQEWPAYQAYVALAWLRAVGVVRAHGRRGYSIVSKEPLPQAVEAAWNCLPEGAE